MGVCILDFELKAEVINFNTFKQVLAALPYGSTERVMVLMLAYTGCRLTELDNMNVFSLQGNTIYWKTGKNQKGHRKESLPTPYIQELKFYRQTHKVSGRLFGIDHRTFRRDFNQLRKSIGGVWAEKGSTKVHCDIYKVWAIQLRFFRKTFQTLVFKYYYDKFGDAGAALEHTSARMKHSSKGITAYHYLRNYDVIDVHNWVNNFFQEKPTYEAQRRLTEY